MASRASSKVDLLSVVEVLHEHLTPGLCAGVFDDVRDTERRRLWTLERLAGFWTQVVLRAPASLTHALAEATGGGSSYPQVESTSQAFFAHCQGMRPDFFATLFEEFRRAVASGEPARFATAHRAMADRFAGVWVADGSKLDAVARRLKVLWDDRRVPLPGSLLAFYDLRHGVLARLAYNPDAQPSELHDAIAGLDDVPEGTLFVGDRLYGVPKFFAALSARGLFAVARRHGAVKLTKLKLLGKGRRDGGAYEDWEVTAGTGQHGTPQTLRWIRWQKGRTVRDVVTNVLDPRRLEPAEALALYRERWKVERLFFDLKEVLNLNRFYAANRNAVAMQVYACAIVHTALRVAQGRIATQARIEPETLSVPKLFPKVAAASACLATAEIVFKATVDANPGITLVKPDWGDLPFASTRLGEILIEKRGPLRRKRRFCEARRIVRSLPRSPRKGPT
jgi:hypothetical protein